jgi:hypothetical protein
MTADGVFDRRRGPQKNVTYDKKLFQTRLA